MKHTLRYRFLGITGNLKDFADKVQRRGGSVEITPTVKESTPDMTVYYRAYLHFETINGKAKYNQFVASNRSIYGGFFPDTSATALKEVFTPELEDAKKVLEEYGIEYEINDILYIDGLGGKKIIKEESAQESTPA